MKKLIIGIASLFALVILLSVAWFFFFVTEPELVDPTQNPSVSFPVSGSTSFPASNGATSASPAGMLAVGALGGGSVITKDFINNGTTIPDTANSGRYLLAGDLGYCVSDPAKCQAGTATSFNIFYDQTSEAFSIALLKEPLGSVRLEVEQFLIKTLGITQAEMCRLDYYIGTTSGVNSFYDSRNLGFSFCPGATKLPD